MVLRKANWVIGVIGHTGMVGSEVYKYYNQANFNVLGYSIDKKKGFPISSWGKINAECNIVFVCVPTPFDFKKRRVNSSIVESVLKKIRDDKIVVIKSTIWPGSTRKFQKMFPRIKIIFNPEFLSRSTAERDFAYPDRQLVGYTNKSRSAAQDVLKLLPKAKYKKILQAEEAELVKYAHNIFGPIRIIYANHLYEVCDRLKIDYSKVKEAFVASEFIGPGILRYMKVVHHGKKRGFGGPCFPKDLASYIEFCKEVGIKAELAEATREANVRILKDQGLTELDAEKKL